MARQASVLRPGGRPFVVFDFVAENARILEISLIADARRIKGT
jgi:hypothetical protein